MADVRDSLDAMSVTVLRRLFPVWLLLSSLLVLPALLTPPGSAARARPLPSEAASDASSEPVAEAPTPAAVPPPLTASPVTLSPVTVSPVAASAVAASAAAVGPRVEPGHGVWPLDPRPDVVARFDPPSTRFGPGHRGVDLLGRPGQPVRAALAGRISFAGLIAGRGVIAVDHGGTRTTYEPVDASVKIGDHVAAGQVIGRLQVGGSHCIPRTCLHWGLIEGVEHYLDPLTLVGLGPVRLLPLSPRGPAP